MNNYPRPTCSCRAKTNSPVGFQKNVIYSATVTHSSSIIKEYIGSTSRRFKKRLYEHKSSFPSKRRKWKPRNYTELANYLWKFSDNNTQYEIKWKILHHTKADINPLILCTLCNLGCREIAKADRRRSLSKRNDLVTQCPHRFKKFF